MGGPCHENARKSPLDFPDFVAALAKGTREKFRHPCGDCIFPKNGDRSRYDPSWASSTGLATARDHLC